MEERLKVVSDLWDEQIAMNGAGYFEQKSRISGDAG
jgi:hypothetical protein